MTMIICFSIIKICGCFIKVNPFLMWATLISICIVILMSSFNLLVNIFWPPDVKSQLTGKEPDVRKD